jgi:hypothetical protein
MAYLYEQNPDAVNHSRIYLGSDTHGIGLLMGAALACFWNPWTRHDNGRLARGFRLSAAILALAILGGMATLMNTSSTWLYRGAFLWVPLATCALIWAAMLDRTWFASALLRTAPMQWLGLRSYSLYLMHWPIFIWTRLLGYTDFSNWIILACVLSVVGVSAELLYRCVEAPSRDWLKKPGRRIQWALIGGYGIIVGVFYLAAVGLRSSLPALPLPTSTVATADPIAPIPAEPLKATTDAHDDALDATIRFSGGDKLFALGDSVLLGARDHLRKTIPGIQVDAEVARQAKHGRKVVRAWRDKLPGDATVLVHLGTNGYINEDDFRAILQDLAGCKSVILINMHAERRWTAPNNELIARMLRDYPNTRLVDWNAVSANRPEYFVTDGIHLTRSGILAFTEQIRIATGAEPLPVPQAAPGDGEGERRLAERKRKGKARSRGVKAATAPPTKTAMLDGAGIAQQRGTP